MARRLSVTAGRSAMVLVSEGSAGATFRETCRRATSSRTCSIAFAHFRVSIAILGKTRISLTYRRSAADARPSAAREGSRQLQRPVRLKRSSAPVGNGGNVVLAVRRRARATSARGSSVPVLQEGVSAARAPAETSLCDSRARAEIASRPARGPGLGVTVRRRAMTPPAHAGRGSGQQREAAMRSQVARRPLVTVVKAAWSWSVRVQRA